LWAETENGWGVTEGGSSGSPIFDVYGRIIGTLTGGQASCTSTQAPDYYGKFSYHWDSNGIQDTQQLKPWLDPDNTGLTSMSGTVRDTIPVEPEPPLSTNVNIEPNPVFNDLLIFKFENVLLKEAKINIANLSGQTVFTRDVTFSVNKYVMDIAPLPKGFYIATVIFDNLTFEKKFIKQ
jgi:hypothetical protein